MILFHGTTEIIEKPNVSFSKSYLDFVVILACHFLFLAEMYSTLVLMMSVMKKSTTPSRKSD